MKLVSTDSEPSQSPHCLFCGKRITAKSHRKGAVRTFCTHVCQHKEARSPQCGYL